MRVSDLCVIRWRSRLLSLLLRYLPPLFCSSASSCVVPAPYVPSAAGVSTAIAISSVIAPGRGWLPLAAFRLLAAPAWAPPGSLLPGRLSPTPPVPEAIPGSVMNSGISCPLGVAWVLALGWQGEICLLPWVKGCWGGVPLTLGSRGWRGVWASRPPLRPLGCPSGGSLRHCLGTPAIEVCRGGQRGPPPSAPWHYGCPLVVS